MFNDSGKAAVSLIALVIGALVGLWQYCAGPEEIDGVETGEYHE